jgi:hypothetical protein
MAILVVEAASGVPRDVDLADGNDGLQPGQEVRSVRVSFGLLQRFAFLKAVDGRHG